MTTDPVEFDKYEENGAYHWHLTDRSWTNFDYNPLMEARFEVIVRELKRVEDEGALLDLGCGDGFLLARIGAACSNDSLFGVDLEKRAVRIAEQKLDQRDFQVDLRRGSAYDLPYGESSFSIVVMTEVIEHLKEPEKAIQEAHRVLQPGGLFLITTPHRQSGFTWDPKYHVHEFAWSDLSALLERNFESVTGKAFLPMSWVRRWRQGLSSRVAIRFYSRLFYNPMMRTSADPSTQYGQILALSRKETVQ